MAFLAPILAGVGEAAGTAAGAVGSALGSAASGIGSTLASTAGELGSLFAGGEGAAAGAAAPASMLGNFAGGLESLVTGGAEAAPGFVGPPAALAGPAVTGPGFASGLLQGYLGTLGNYPAASAGTQVGGSLGQLVQTLQALHGGSPAAPPLQPIGHPYAGMAGGPATHLLSPSILASPGGSPAQGPIMKMLGGLLAGF
jgi:hypothetical protein